MKKVCLGLLFLVFIPLQMICQAAQQPNDSQTDEMSQSLIAQDDNQNAQTPRRHVDGTSVLIHGPERTQILCKSDHERRGIDSRKKEYPELISDELTYQEAIRFKLPIDDNIVRENLRRTLQQFGLKLGDEQVIFAQEGYSNEEGFEKFREMYAVNAMMEQQVKSMTITEDEVIDYYNKNPIVKEPVYLLQTAFVPFEKEKGKKVKGLEKDIEKYIKTGKGLDVQWSEPYWLKKSEIAEHLDFITQMPVDSIEKQKLANGFQLYRLNKSKPERVVPLKKRYKEIVEILRRPKFEETITKYKKILLDNATIIYL